VVATQRQVLGEHGRQPRLRVGLDDRRRRADDGLAVGSGVGARARLGVGVGVAGVGVGVGSRFAVRLRLR
jgi:hypothetical protein